MKRIVFYVVTLLSLVFLSACDRRHNKDNFDNIDNTAPSAPTGVVVSNYNNNVEISWNPSSERDVAGYNVYYGYSYNGKYTLITSTQNNYYTDYGANGITYCYAVTAFDYNGNESELSRPRPQGMNQEIFNYRSYPNTSGFSFSSYSVVPYNAQSADFYYDNDNGSPYLVVWSDSDIQDMGPTNNINDIPYAPTSGWSSTKDAAAVISGHTYIIWTMIITMLK